MARGQLILIEGLDRSGKSTQVEILAKKLNGKVLKFPNRETAVGQIIDRYLREPTFTLPDESVHLLFLANRWESAQYIIDTLNLGCSIVLDRYIYSGIAYTLAKNSSNDTTINNVDWLYSPDKGLPKPDVTFFLTLSMDVLASRKGWGEERYENEQFQLKVKSCFEQIFKTPGHEPIVLDVSQKNIEETTEMIWGHLKDIGTTDEALKVLT